MKKFEIINTISGISLGIYEADSTDGALEAMARDAGYASFAEAEEVAPGVDDLKAVEVED